MNIKEISVGACTLCMTGTDNELKISDVELARILGYRSIHEVRKRILRYIKEGILKDVEIIATVSENGLGRPGRMYMLTEQQALFIAARCETAVANQVLQEVINVFCLARRGLLPAQVQPQPAMDMVAFAEVMSRAVAQGVAAGTAPVLEHFTRATAVLVDGMQKLIDKNLQDHVEGTHVAKQVIGSGAAWSIRERIRSIAEIKFPNDASYQRREISAMHMNLRTHLQYFGTRRNWHLLPQDKWQPALNWLEEQYRSAMRLAKLVGHEPESKTRTAMQLSFGWGDPDKDN